MTCLLCTFLWLQQHTPFRIWPGISLNTDSKRKDLEPKWQILALTVKGAPACQVYCGAWINIHSCPQAFNQQVAGRQAVCLAGTVCMLWCPAWCLASCGHCTGLGRMIILWKRLQHLLRRPSEWTQQMRNSQTVISPLATAVLHGKHLCWYELI